MNSLRVVCSAIITSATLFASAADNPQLSRKLTAEEVVTRNISARGGISAWRAVQSLSLTGKIEAGGNNRPALATTTRKASAHMPAARPVEQIELPLLIDLKRSRKSRIEVQFNGQTAVQVFDGSRGWKLRPFLNRHEVEPYSPAELKAANSQADLDGPLIDYAAKGSKISLEGAEKLGDRDVYKLTVTTRDAQAFHLWIDANTFLEVKMEGSPGNWMANFTP